MINDDFRESSIATCRSALEYCDDMLGRYDAWQRSHPEATPCDLELLLVLRGQARRLLAAIRAGDPIPPEAFAEMSGSLAEFDLSALLYRSDNIGAGGIRRSPEADRKHGVR